MLPSDVNREPSTDTFLFVYGTLMTGFENPYSSQLRQHSKWLGTGYFTGHLYRISWYPGAIYRPAATSKVHGEIYRLSDPKLLIPLLDAYEDLDEDPAKSLYVRQIVPVSTPEGKIFPCWTYLYNQSTEGLFEYPDGKFPNP
jgi:gamma-glutamylcyclotransferase (GGCT)/AIG2-like uncharacterized protein YtfP